MRFHTPQRRTATVIISLIAPGMLAVAASVEPLSSVVVTTDGLHTDDPMNGQHSIDQAYLQLFQSSLANEQYYEAEVAAKQLLEYLLRNDQATAIDTANALGNLARVQKLMEQYEASSQNYDAAIQIIESDSDRLNSNLVAPLIGLAETHRAGGDYFGAMQAYERALHINHVNDGPHSLSQIGVLNGMVNTDLDISNYDAAFDLLERIRILNERMYSPTSIKLLPVLQRRADLLKQLQRPREERQVYRRIVDILRAHHGESDPSLIEPLLALSRTYVADAGKVVFRSEPTSENGATFLKRALRLAEINADVDWQTLEKCLLAFGDYYMLLGVNSLARIHYGRAWQLTSSDAASLEHRRQHLEQPIRLRRPGLGRYANFAYGWDLNDIDPDDFVEGFMTARFAVTKRGRTTDIELVEADPPGFTRMETRVRKGVRNFMYRPRHEAGEPVRTDDLTFQHRFLYRPSEVN